MKPIVLNIGEVEAVNYPATLTCFGLGSCIGLFVQDRANGISGGAHILLPAGEQMHADDGKQYNVSDAFHHLMDQFRSMGSSLEGLRAKVVGGATVLQSSWSTGEQNVRSVIDFLVRNKIYIAASDVGGKYSRTAHFNSDNGELRVRTSECNAYKII